ncbi:MAG: hypothetical protein RKE49_14335 [Oceanicaulis sp.]
MTKAAKRYTRRMAIFAVVYAAAIFGVNLIDDALALSAPARVGLALIPVLPALYMVFAVISFVRDMDEVQARIIMESVLAGAAIVSLASFTYGMVRGAVELPAIEAYWYLPALAACSGLAQIVIVRRFR